MREIVLYFEKSERKDPMDSPFSCSKIGNVNYLS